MITVYPHNDDWRNLQSLTGDPSWSPASATGTWSGSNNAATCPSGAQTTDPVTRHGFAGWLPVSTADPTLALGDKQLLKLLAKAYLFAEVALHEPEEVGLLADKSLSTDSTKKDRLSRS